MAKKEFTDITIKMCQRECHFKRVTNETLTKFSEKAEKDYDETVKTFVNEVELLDDKRDALEKKIELKTKQVSILEKKSDATDEDLEQMFALLEDIEKLNDELNIVKAGLLDLNEKSPVKEYTKKADELVAEKVETLLDGITAAQFLKESDPVDSIKARNLEKYYQMAIIGERESKILNEMREDVDNFLQSQKELRS